ncbi:MAG TPA: xylose isomerase [Opitutae bacterium]|nr:xylose isomerase [Opitutaceae bacterium]HCR30327.1 xylose isomerase [Opitutae bacterium]
MKSRREFVKSSFGLAAATLAVHPSLYSAHHEKWFDISLAQWSLHRAFRGGDKDAMDFAKIAKSEFGIEAIEYVNQFYMENFTPKVVNELKKRSKGEGVDNALIMCDRLGRLGDPDKAARLKTVDNHKVWADAAKELDCHSIRVNAGSAGSYAEQMKLAADGLSRLGDYGDSIGINVIVENHGGLSSNGAWLAGVMKLANHPRVGTLPDFGNFIIDRSTGESYDRYRGTRELMPFARGVSAKSHDFDDDGNEIHTDFKKMLSIVKDAGYRGYIGVEYEGRKLGEAEGIRATKKLLQKLGGR